MNQGESMMDVDSFRDSNDGESVVKEQDGEKQRSDERVLGNESLVIQLPPEILRLVFKYLPGSCRKKVRLTCKLWYSECNDNETMFISGPEVEYEYLEKCLENCQLKKLNILFARVDIGKFPSTVWENLGTNIHSLKFIYCKLGNQSIENIILFCDNMKSLQFHLRNPCTDESGIFPETIDNINITREKLETLNFGVRSNYVSDTEPNYDVERWIRIFRGLYRIYSNVIHHGAYNIDEHQEGVTSKFSKTANETDQQTLAEIMAFSLFREQSVKLIEILSTLRLKTLSLSYCRILLAPNDPSAVTSLWHSLFTNCKELESVDLKLGSEIDNEKALLLHIINQCPKLQRLKFETSRWNEKMNLLSADEWSLISPKFKELSIEGCVWKNPSSFGISNESYQTSTSSFNLMKILPAENIRHLTLNFVTSNDVLQYIFQHMTNLTSLKIGFRKAITDYGLTGWCETNKSRTGFSIQRLQNLEQLTIHMIPYTRITDQIYDEFNFPKLQYLHCPTPKKSSILLRLAENIPSMTEFKLTSSHNISSRLLMDVCQLLKKLRILHVGMFYIDDIEQIFEICPTLQFAHTYVGTYCYDLGAEKVVYKQINTTNQVISNLSPYIR